MVKVALFADTTITKSGITAYCYSLKSLLESSGIFSVSVFTDLPYRRLSFFHFYDRNSIKNALLSDDFDLIHINGFISTIPFYLFKVMKSLGIHKPVVYTPHAHPFHTLKHPFLARVFFQLFVKRYLKRANAVISINKEDKSFFSKYNKNVVTIPHWSDKQIEPIEPNVLKGQEEKPMILFVGRNDDNKNLSILYALPKNKYRIVCVTNKKPLRDDFIFKNRVSDEELIGLYQKAALTIIPSRYEAFSYTALESLLAGTPILISNRVRIADFIENISGVIVFDYENKTDITNQIDRAINQVVDVDSVQSIFSVDKAFSSYSNVYNQLCLHRY